MLKARFIMVSVLCIFTILFLVSMAYADWPPSGKTIKAGYAQLNDSTSYKFRSDGGGYYTDVHLIGAPREKVELALSNTGVLEGVLLYLGKPEFTSIPPSVLGDPSYYCSSRKSDFWFDILKDGTLTSLYEQHKAALDILAYTDSSKSTRRGNPVNGKYYLNNNIVRLAIRRWLDDGGSLVHDLIFTVEPSDTPCDGCGTGAVTQTAIDAFYGDDTDVDYRDAKQVGTSDCDLVIYRISYDRDFSTSTVKGKKSTWTVSGSGSAHLGVLLADGSMVRLVDYKSLSFSVTVSTTYPFSAPPRWNTTTTLWGDIKSQE